MHSFEEESPPEPGRFQIRNCVLRGKNQKGKVEKKEGGISLR